MKKKVFSITEEVGRLPYMIFYQSKGGWPGFQLLSTFEDAEKIMDRMKKLGLNPVLYMDLSDADIVENKNGKNQS